MKKFTLTYSKDYASLTPRFVARMIDSLLLSLYLPVGLIYFSFSTDVANLISRVMIFIVSAMIPMSFVQIFYYVFSIFKFGKTVGKEIVGLKVTDENKKLLSWKMSAFRSLIAFPVSTVVLGLGIWAMAFDDKHQAWHDLLTGSLVKKTKDGLAVGVVTALVLMLIFVGIGYQGFSNFKANEELLNDTVMVSSTAQELFNDSINELKSSFSSLGED